MKPKFEIGEIVKHKKHDFKGKVVKVYEGMVHNFYDVQEEGEDGVIAASIVEIALLSIKKPTLKILFKYHPKPIEVEDIEFEMI